MQTCQNVLHKSFSKRKVQTWYFCNILIHQEKSSWPLLAADTISRDNTEAWLSKQTACSVTDMNELKKKQLRKVHDTGTKYLCSPVTKGTAIGRNNGSCSVMRSMLVPGNPTEALTTLNQAVLLQISEIKKCIWTCLTLICPCKKGVTTALATVIYSSLSQWEKH